MKRMMMMMMPGDTKTDGLRFRETENDTLKTWVGF